MSAYFVSASTIDAVVTLLRRRNVATIPDSHPDLASLHYSPARSPDEVGRQLLQLNRDAMVARYPALHRTEEDRGMIAAAHAYTFRPRHNGDPTLAKSLACFLYQCSEGDIDQRALYRALRDLEQAATPPAPSATLWRDPRAWAARKEYDAAPWGLDDRHDYAA